MRMVLGGAFGIGAVMVACGGSSSSDDGAAGGSAGQMGSAGTAGTAGAAGGSMGSMPTQAEVDACRAFQTAVCGKIEQCQPGIFGVFFTDQNDCIEGRTAACAELALAPGASSMPADIETCAAAWTALDCDGYNEAQNNAPPIAGCEIPAGALANGEPCVGGGQCQSLLCKGRDEATCGTCETRGAESEPCSNTFECDFGLVCAQSSCKKEKLVGETCGQFEAPCKRPLRCVGGTCAAGIAEGQSCDPSFGECDNIDDALFCNRTTRVCEKFGAATSLGDPCGLLPGGGAVGCESPLRCEVTNTQTFVGGCVMESGPGEPCFDQTQFGLSPVQCRTGLECINDVCVEPDRNACG